MVLFRDTREAGKDVSEEQSATDSTEIGGVQTMPNNSEATRLAVPFARSYWVVPGLLLAGYYPGSLNADEASAQIQGLLNAGIRRVVNLMEVEESNHGDEPFVPYEPVLTMLAAEEGVAAKMERFPIRDQCATTHEHMTEILNCIDSAIETGLPVYVHCWGGKGRTGMVVGCYLARHGIASGAAALETVRDLRKRDPKAHEPSPETSEQRALVTGWCAGE
jgi:hypothetical protein